MRELNSTEIEQIGGGPLPAVVAYAISFGSNFAIRGIIGYYSTRIAFVASSISVFRSIGGGDNAPRDETSR